MNGFLFFVAIVTGIVLLLRYFRKREIEAFRDADIAVLEQFRATAGKQAGAVAELTPGADTPALPSNVFALPVQAVAADVSAFELKPAVFDEVIRSILVRLEEAVVGRYRILVDVPLDDFVRSEVRAEAMRLRNRRVSFALTPRHNFELVAGIYLKGAGMDHVKEHEFLDSVFTQIGKPLLDFPLVADLSVAEIREQLDAALGAHAEDCPRCAKQMVLRRVSRGRKAGKTFWVCPDYPTCNSTLAFSG